MSPREETTRALYDRSALGWQRDQPVMLSDFTARPVVMKELGDMTGRRVVDLGCGEGYVSRMLCEAGCGLCGWIRYLIRDDSPGDGEHAGPCSGSAELCGPRPWRDWDDGATHL